MIKNVPLDPPVSVPQDAEAKSVAVALVEVPVFPSDKITVQAIVPEGDLYGGAHHYQIQKCLGFADGETKYLGSEDEAGNPVPNMQELQFVQKNDDGTIVPGVQSEQVIIALMDRHTKLDKRFPSPQHVRIMQGLRMALQAMEERVRERMERGVMGDLKK